MIRDPDYWRELLSDSATYDAWCAQLLHTLCYAPGHIKAQAIHALAERARLTPLLTAHERSVLRYDARRLARYLKSPEVAHGRRICRLIESIAAQDRVWTVASAVRLMIPDPYTQRDIALAQVALTKALVFVEAM